MKARRRYTNRILFDLFWDIASDIIADVVNLDVACVDHLVILESERKDGNYAVNMLHDAKACMLFLCSVF